MCGVPHCIAQCIINIDDPQSDLLFDKLTIKWLRAPLSKGSTKNASSAVHADTASRYVFTVCVDAGPALIASARLPMSGYMPCIVIHLLLV